MKLIYDHDQDPQLHLQLVGLYYSMPTVKQQISNIATDRPRVDGCDGDDDDDNNCNGDNDDNSCDCYDDRDNEVVEGC